MKLPKLEDHNGCFCDPGYICDNHPQFSVGSLYEQIRELQDHAETLIDITEETIVEENAVR